MADPEGRLVVVTGSSSGIGRAIADDLHSAGWTLAYLDIRPAGIEPDARRAEFACDVADEDSVRAAFAAAERGFGRPIWGCFANAGVSGGADSLIDVPTERFRQLVEINLVGAFITIREAALAMRVGPGRIVATASTAGMGATLATGVPYAASKAGVINLVQQAAIRLAPRAITVNAICPGPIETEIGGGAMHDPAVASRLAAGVPLGRVGQPPELTGLARLLVSDDSAFITGQVIAVDGGMTAVRGSYAGRA